MDDDELICAECGCPISEDEAETDDNAEGVFLCPDCASS